MKSSRTVIVAGAGIGGLTAALALARNGFRVTVLEQAERLEETGAGIQLSPNASRTLIDLGLENELRPSAVAPAALRILNAISAREIARMPLGEAAAERYGAPYWVTHRGDLQAALLAAVSRRLDITLKLGLRAEDFATHPHGVTVAARDRSGMSYENGTAFVAADGLWSQMRERMGDGGPARFSGRSAWRGLVLASSVAPEFREPLIHLWLGRNAHLVHYPVRAGRLINIVVITADNWKAPGWSEPASRDDLAAQLTSEQWCPKALALIGAPDAWLKWALYDRQPLLRWSKGSAALLGDAAHPALPYMAQGAAMAIEDAAVIAHCLARQPDDAAAALREYCAVRRRRAWKVQRLAARTGTRYHLATPAAMLRDAALRMMGGARLLRRYDWLYDWRLPVALSVA